MNNILQIPEETQTRNKALVADFLKRVDFYGKVHRNASRPSVEEVRVLDAFEQFLANVLNVCETFNESDIDESLVRQFAFFASAQDVVHNLPDVNVGALRVRFDVKQNLTKLVFQDVVSEFLSNRGTESLPVYAVAFFQTIADQMRNEALANPNHNVFDGYTLLIGTTTVNGFNVVHKEVERVHTDGTTWDDVIGSESTKKTLRAYVDDLLCYDATVQKNPISEVYAIPSTVMLCGQPGTGKTTLLKAMINYFYERAATLGKNVRVVMVTNDFASKFKSESAANLKRLFEEASDPTTISLLLIEDLDAFFPSRDELTGEPEEKQVFGTILNLLQGITTAQRGNYIVFATSNRIDILDLALAQRFNEFVEVDGPTCGDDLAKIAKLKLGKKLRFLNVDNETLSKFGTEAFEHKLVGRDVDNVVQMFVSETMATIRLDMPLEIYRLGYDEKVAWLKENYGKCGAGLNGEILQTLQRYVEHRYVADNNPLAHK